MKTHCNYVLGFSDGSVKVGVTSRLRERVLELSRAKRNVAILIAGICAPACDKASAFQIEAGICSLLAYRSIYGSREWFTGGAGEFDYLKQTTGMFWHQVCNHGHIREIQYMEVSA